VDNVLILPLRAETSPNILCVTQIRDFGTFTKAVLTETGDCIERKRMGREIRWRAPVNGAIFRQVQARLRSAGVNTDYLPPLGSDEMARDKYGLMPKYPANNAPHDVLIDFSVSDYGFTKALNAQKDEAYSPYLTGVFRLVDGQTGKIVVERRMVYGPDYMDRTLTVWVPPHASTFLPDFETIIRDERASMSALDASALMLADAVATYLLSRIDVAN
jgi:hypothetical protein